MRSSGHITSLFNRDAGHDAASSNHAGKLFAGPDQHTFHADCELPIPEPVNYQRAIYAPV